MPKGIHGDDSQPNSSYWLRAAAIKKVIIHNPQPAGISDHQSIGRQDFYSVLLWIDGAVVTP
jgi:hypothetical protein